MAVASDPLLRMIGTEKAAAFMLAVGEEYGKPIWELLSDEEIRIEVWQNPGLPLFAGSDASAPAASPGHE